MDIYNIYNIIIASCKLIVSQYLATSSSEAVTPIPHPVSSPDMDLKHSAGNHQLCKQLPTLYILLWAQDQVSLYI